MPFVEDLGDFFAAEDFAETVTVDGVQVPAIFDNAYAESLGAAGTGPQLTCRSSDLATVAPGDAAIVRGVTYEVVTVEPDGTGVTVLRLVEV